MSQETDMLISSLIINFCGLMKHNKTCFSDIFYHEYPLENGNYRLARYNVV